MSTQEQTQTNPLCKNNCGFFGNPNTLGMCSKCYKDFQLNNTNTQTNATNEQNNISQISNQTDSPIQEPPKPQPAPITQTTPPQAITPTPHEPQPQTPDQAASSTPTPLDDGLPAKQVNTSRCWTCNRKIGLLGFQCKCEYFFCAQHRYSDKHECTFDFKSMGKEQLSKANPTIAASKLQSF